MSNIPTSRPTIAIPLWVTIFALIVCILGGALGVMTLFVQTDPGMTVSWGGRTIGLAIVTGMAVYLKSPILYMAAFAGGIARDFGDMIAEMSKVEPSTGATVGAVLFILLGIGGFIAANISRKSEANVL
ncbi:MAG: hypothetical protein COB24_10155 [Hyphomicrobiales bacterium]|nr:MAG: hypothetical protein COB24_10155 [Hyphomicrobiales bacterium]